MRHRKGVALDGKVGREELGGVEGGETIIRIYYVRAKVCLIKGKKLTYMCDCHKR